MPLPPHSHEWLEFLKATHEEADRREFGDRFVDGYELKELAESLRTIAERHGDKRLQRIAWELDRHAVGYIKDKKVGT
jgi:hypothetical protein